MLQRLLKSYSVDLKRCDVRLGQSKGLLFPHRDLTALSSSASATEGIVRLKVKCHLTVGTAESLDAHRLLLSSSSLPTEIISHSVWLYFRFALSFRDVEEMLAQRGVVLTYETIRAWCLKIGQTYANDLRRRSPRPGDKWYLDEVFLKINGSIHYLWRAVDQDGEVLDIMVQSRRDKGAAKKFLRKLLKRLRYVPRVIIADKLKS